MARFASGVGRLPCDRCKNAFRPSRWDTEEDKKRKADGPPCGECRPELLSDNLEAWEVYTHCQDQLIIGMMGAVAINTLAVKLRMDLEGVQDQKDCLDKVQTISRCVLDEQRIERQKQEDAKK